MPAVNPSLDPIRSRVNLAPVPWDPLRLLSNIGTVAAVISFLFALQIVARYKRHRQSRTLVRRPKGSSLQQMDQEHWDKSRGVSNPTWVGMSANRHPDSFHGHEQVIRLTQHHEEGFTWPTEPLDGTDIGFSENARMEAPRKDFLGARPPLPLPLTPPRPAISVPFFQERRMSKALSSTGDLDSSFFSQPNPDYSFDSSPLLTSSSAQDSSVHTMPRRRSYTKTLPLGPPQPVSWLEEDGTLTAFTSSSLPSSSPTLPPAPHESSQGRGIDVQGEVISVLDNSGAGWKRHTRVYGGGVCLACLASADGEGGFYGARVRQEEKR